MRQLTRIVLTGAGMVAALVCAAGAAAEERERPAVSAYRVDEAPKVDGGLDEPTWVDVARRHRGVMAGWRSGKSLAGQQRIAYVCHDKKNLYIGMQAFTPDIYKLEAGKGSPFVGDCLEIHLRHPDGKRYWQFGVDVEANVGNGRSEPGTDVNLIKAATDFGDNYWTLEVASPWAMLDITPKPGLQFGFTLSANRAYQGNGRWMNMQWGAAHWVKQGKTVLELGGLIDGK